VIWYEVAGLAKIFSCPRQGAPLTPTDSIFTLAEGLQRLYGEEASLLIRQFAAENAKAGDAVSAAFWNGIALAISNSKSFMTHSMGEPGP
jgi:hypothetical protein